MSYIHKSIYRHSRTVQSYNNRILDFYVKNDTIGRIYVSAKRHLKISAHFRNIRQSLIVVNLFWNTF